MRRFALLAFGSAVLAGAGAPDPGGAGEGIADAGAADAGIADAGTEDAGGSDGPTTGPAVALRGAREAVRRMQAAEATLEDLTCTFHKREYVQREMGDQERIALKLRRQPHSVYMGWLGPAHQGQEVLWRKGWNRDEARAHPGSFPDWTVDLHVDSWLMRRGSRHPVTHAGMGFLIGILARDLDAALARPSCLAEVTDLGSEVVHGEASRCFDLVGRKDRCRSLYATRVVFCIGGRLDLPTRVKVWDVEDEELRVVEEYGFEGCRVGVGLGDADFDPANKAYRF